MASTERVQYPFKLIPLEEETQKKIAADFLGYPNGFNSCNNWGLKLLTTATKEDIEDMYNYPLDPRDIWVVTPPKCGTTWTQEMVWLIANDLDYEGAKVPLVPERWNFIEYMAFSDKFFIKKLFSLPENQAHFNPFSMTGDPNRPSPKFVKTHLPISMNNPRLLDTCKVVYVARNPKDACVSYYFHQRLITRQDFTGNMELFMDYFMDGNLVLTPFIEHIIEAWNLRHHPNMCFIFYEDMKSDLRSQIRKIAKFLGKELSEEQIEKLAGHLHIDNFKNNTFVNRENNKKTGVMHTDRGNFIRNGKTGDWKNHFTPEMNAKFDRWMAEKMKGDYFIFNMLSELLKEHQAKQHVQKQIQETRRKEAIASSNELTAAMVDHLNVGVAQAYLNQKRLDSEAKQLYQNAAAFSKQSQQWLQLMEGFNTALKELGDVENWARTIEADMRIVNDALELSYKAHREATQPTQPG